eukprot:Polyplicarium_translucidae@DN3180_c0_g2_i1.p1
MFCTSHRRSAKRPDAVAFEESRPLPPVQIAERASCHHHRKWPVELITHDVMMVSCLYACMLCAVQTMKAFEESCVAITESVSHGEPQTQLAQLSASPEGWPLALAAASAVATSVTTDVDAVVAEAPVTPQLQESPGGGSAEDPERKPSTVPSSQRDRNEQEESLLACAVIRRGNGTAAGSQGYYVAAAAVGQGGTFASSVAFEGPDGGPRRRAPSGTANRCWSCEKPPTIDWASASRVEDPAEPSQSSPPIRRKPRPVRWPTIRSGVPRNPSNVVKMRDVSSPGPPSSPGDQEFDIPSPLQPIEPRKTGDGRGHDAGDSDRSNPLLHVDYGSSSIEEDADSRPRVDGSSGADVHRSNTPHSAESIAAYALQPEEPRDDELGDRVAMSQSMSSDSCRR